MPDYRLIIADLIVFSIIFMTAYYLSKLYPGEIKESSAAKGRVAHRQTEIVFRRFIQCAYILGFSFLLELILTGILLLNPLSTTMMALLSLDELHYDAWLVFWGAAAAFYFIEYRYRTYYLHANKVPPISSLLSSVLRSLLLFGVSLWLAKYILNWHGVHILVSATAFVAIAGFALKGTIGDFLAGLSIQLSQGVMPSQWISLPRLNIEGEVIVSNWRETRIRTTSGHIHIVPNSLLARQHFHNMSWPDSLRRHNLSFTLSAENNPDIVKEALLKAATASDKIMTDPNPPKVIIKAYLDFGIHYQLRVWSDTFHDSSGLENEVYQAAWVEFDRLGVKFLKFPSSLNAINQVI